MDWVRVKVNYRLRDAIFSRQRYWGEPFPVYYNTDQMPYMIPDRLPAVGITGSQTNSSPRKAGNRHLGHATKWAWDTVNRCVDGKLTH